MSKILLQPFPFLYLNDSPSSHLKSYLINFKDEPLKIELSLEVRTFFAAADGLTECLSSLFFERLANLGYKVLHLVKTH